MDDFITSQMPPSAEQIEDEKSTEQKAIETQQQQDDFAVAALKDHPGWIQIKEQMESDIKELRELKGVNFNQATDKELGEMVRAEFRTADKLEAYLYKIENAVKAVVNNDGQQTG